MNLALEGIPCTWTGTYRTPLGPPLLLVGGLPLHFVPRTRQHDLRLRISEFTSRDMRVPSEEPSRRALRHRANTWLGRFGWWPRFKEDVEIALIERTAVDVFFLTVLGTISTATALSLLASSPLVSLPMMMIAPALALSGALARPRAGSSSDPRRLIALSGAMLPAPLGTPGFADANKVARTGTQASTSCAKFAARCPERLPLQRAIGHDQRHPALPAPLLGPLGNQPAARLRHGVGLLRGRQLLVQAGRSCPYRAGVPHRRASG